MHFIPHIDLKLPIPTLRELSNLQFVDWFSLGLELDVEEYELEVIEMNHPANTKRCKAEMFATWLKTDLDASWGKLAIAFAAIGKVDLAVDLCIEYGKFVMTILL